MHVLSFYYKSTNAFDANRYDFTVQVLPLIFHYIIEMQISICWLCEISFIFIPRVENNEIAHKCKTQLVWAKKYGRQRWSRKRSWTKCEKNFILPKLKETLYKIFSEKNLVYSKNENIWIYVFFFIGYCNGSKFAIP